MKKSIFLCFILLTICFFLTEGCIRRVKPGENAVRFDSIEIDETCHLFNDTTQPCCNIRIHYVYPDSFNEQSTPELQNLFIEKMFGETFKGLSPEQVLKEYTQQYINSFRRFETSGTRGIFIEEEGNQYSDSSGYACYTQLHNSILYNQSGFISFLIETVDYAGGMHNSKCAYAYVVNLSTGELLQEKDFAGINYRQNLSPILVEKIAAANGLTDSGELENLGYISLSDIAPNANFTINNEGITYYFNENEIAGTREGIIRVFIPYDEIKFYVAEESPIALFFN